MRVAILGQYPLDEQRIVGGIESVMVPLSRSLADFDDLELHVVTCQPGVEEQQCATGSHLPLHILRRRRLGRLTFHMRDALHIQRTVAQIAPDVVHAQGTGIYAMAAVHSPYAHVITMHGIVLSTHLRGFIDRFCEWYSIARAKNLICINPYVEQKLMRMGVFHGRLYRIENPVDERFFTVNCQGEEATILYAGRVIPQKGLLNLLQVLAEVRKTHPQVCLRVAGETESAPAYLKICREFIAQQDLEKAVSFLGSLTVEQMVQEFARCTVFALPSQQDTAPVVVAEAMAAGRPVVATRGYGMQSMVEDEQSGLLVEHGDIGRWTQALTRLLSDSALRTRMGRKGRELAQARFHPTVVANATRAVYYEIIR
nr:glycosyltransferase family 4 protein [Chloroflexota bacterium]